MSAVSSKVESSSSLVPHQPVAEKAPSKACPHKECGCYEYLSEILPPYARSVAIAYLETHEKARAFRLCRALNPLLPPDYSGWTVSQCTDEVVRDLFIEKTIGMAADANRRENSYEKNLRVLDEGYWYKSHYRECLTKKCQKKRLDLLKAEGSFYHGHTPKGFIHLTDTELPSGKKHNSYQLEKGVLPSEGLANVRRTACFLDCQEGLQLAMYETLLEIFGEKTFNVIFAADGLCPLRFDLHLHNTPLFQFVSVRTLKDVGTFGKRPVKTGDAVFLQNSSMYTVKQLYCGEWGGFHMGCVQEEPVQKYVGFGGNPEGDTEEQTMRLFAKAVNATPIPMTDRCEAPLAKKIEAAGSKALEQISRDLQTDVDALFQYAKTYQIEPEEFLQTCKAHPERYFSAEIVNLNAAALRKVLQKTR